jgi:Domain of unknown function (DUF4920)
MKKIILSLICIVSLLFTSKAQTSYGDVKVVAETAIDAKDLAIKIKALKQEVADVTIKGTVAGVCQAKGCWMTMAIGNGEEMTIKFKDYAFFMPKDCSGKTVVCHGKAFIKTTSVAELKHLAEDAGKTKKQIAKIKKPKEEVRFEADGVTLN